LSKLAYTVLEAAEATGLGRTKLFAEIKAGRLAAAKIGRRTLIRSEALEKWLRESERASDQQRRAAESA